MPRVIPPEGPTNEPLIAIVGEAPGLHEDQQGRPFVGPSGQLLEQMLAKCGISRSECYITNVSNVRPPSNDFYKMFYDDGRGMIPNGELLAMRERLWNEIRSVKPKIIVPMGAEALKALFQEGSIKSFRGTLIERHGLRAVPTYHPAFVLRMYETRPIVEADLAKAIRQARSPSTPQTRFTVDPTFNEVMNFLSSHKPRYALDIETINNTTRCIGLGWSNEDAISIPILNSARNRWTIAEEVEILGALNDLFLDPKCSFILQNAPYDFTILARDFGFRIENMELDTMFAHHLLFPELPKGLDFLSSIYTDHPMYWNYERGSENSTQIYNCMDCVVTYQSATEILQQMQERGVYDYYRKVIHPAVAAMTRVQSRGMLIDEVERTRVAKETEHEMIEVEKALASDLGFELNPSSPKQVKELVYDKWRLPKQFKPGPERSVTSDEDALKALKKKSTPLQGRILDNIITFRQKRVLLSTFAEMPLKNGRAHTSYNLAGTVTGRIASSSTFDGYGGNLTNIPRGKFRRVFRADPGMVLIKADLSQAEYRVLIWKARIHRVIEKLLDPTFSIHMWNAAENIYRVPYSQVTRKMYDEAKNGTYAANYGVGPHKVSRMYDMDFHKAKFIIESYHQSVPEVQQVYQREIEEQIRTTRTLTNPLGRERVFFGRMDDDLMRAAYSHYCQSTVADIINSALIDLDAQGYEILLQVHDELVVQVPKDKVLEGSYAVRKAMEIPMTFPGVAIPLIIPVEIKVGYNWFDVLSVKDFLIKQELVKQTEWEVDDEDDCC